MPLTEEDLKKIQTLFVESFEEIWDHNLEPNMFTKKEGVALKKDIENVQTSLKKDNQDTRDYVDRKMEGLKGDLVAYDKIIIQKVDTLTEVLEKKQVITQSEKANITRLSPFPVSPIPAE